MGSRDEAFLGSGWGVEIDEVLEAVKYTSSERWVGLIWFDLGGGFGIDDGVISGLAHLMGSVFFFS